MRCGKSKHVMDWAVDDCDLLQNEKYSQVRLSWALEGNIIGNKH